MFNIDKIRAFLNLIKDQETGDEKTTSLDAPTTFGEVSLLFNTKQTGNIIAKSDNTVCWYIQVKIFLNDILKFMKKNPLSNLKNIFCKINKGLRKFEHPK